MSLPTEAENPTGFHLRYLVSKANGEPIDPNAEYLVLRIDNGGRDPQHIHAGQLAALTYADAIKDHLPNLAADLRTRLSQVMPAREVTPLDARLQELLALLPLVPALPWTASVGYDGGKHVDFLKAGGAYDGIRIHWGEKYGESTPITRAVADYIAGVCSIFPNLVERLQQVHKPVLDEALRQQLANLAQLASLTSEGPWHAGCLVKEGPCNCPWITNGAYNGSICDVSIDNGKQISDGGNDAPPLEEAKGNMNFIVAARNLDYDALAAVVAPK
jgi:hypothetical protein